MLAYDIISGLTIKANLGYTNINMKALTTNPISSRDPSVASSSSNLSVFSDRSFQTWIVEPQLTWRRKLGIGETNILIGATLQDQESEGLAQYARGFVNESLMGNIAAASTVFPLTSSYSQYRYAAVFGRVNYNLNDKYIVNLTGRRDGSSRFGPDKQFANFGAIGLAWIFSNERFMKNSLPFISFGKLRASYGITGNDQLGDYNFLDTYTSTGSYQGIVGLTPTRLSNPDFAWETNKKFETGIELGLMNSRISMELSYYDNQSSDQLVGYSLPPTTGFTGIQGNFPATVQNTGIEIQINASNIERKHFSWETSINLSIPRNKLIDFPNLESSSRYANTLVIGRSLNIRKLYHVIGVDSQSGIYQFTDVNEDGSLSVADRQTVRNVSQEFYGGIGNSFHFKGFELDILFQGVKQTGYNPIVSSWGYPGSLSNQSTTVLDRWQEEGDMRNMQKFTSSFSPTAIAYFNISSADMAIVDASFIRLKNVSLSYQVSEGLIEKLRVRNARIFIQGQNLFTITDYEGLDPESQAINLPPLRTIIAGIHLTI
jgi:TonB-linked SusC/RagA family outer membrane protein